MLFAVNFWVNVALLLLTSPGITISAGPFLFRLAYSTGWYIAVSAAAFACCEVLLPAVGDGLPNCGWAQASEAASARADASVAFRTIPGTRGFMGGSSSFRCVRNRRQGFLGAAFLAVPRPAFVQ